MSARLLSVLAAAAALALPAFADDCSVPVGAMKAAASTPHKLTSLNVISGKSMAGALIQTSDKIYIQVGGKWKLSPRTPQQAVADAAEIMKTSKITCKTIGPDVVGGEATTVYAVHTSNQGSESDNKVWISNSKHLPLKTQAQIDGGVTSSTQYDYANVQAPAGVN